MYRVTIIQRVLPHYRMPFFSKLYKTLLENNIELTVVFGEEFPGEVPKTVNCNEKWAYKINNKYFKLFSLNFVWQPCLNILKKSDFIIVEQANRLIINYVVILLFKNSARKIAYWGHGRNMQGSSGNVSEKIKKCLINNVDWWFAYTDLSADYVNKSGYTNKRITSVNNAIDNTELVNGLKKIDQKSLVDLKKMLGIESNNVAIYCGGIYAEKKIDFLFRACIQIRHSLPDFEIIVIGDGPDINTMNRYTENNPWIHYVGPKFGQERIPYFLISKVLLMPGLVGLAIVDSFIMKVPIFTTDIPVHSPEISYLINGENGVMTRFDITEYSQAIISYLNNKDLQERLFRGCQKQSEFITLDNMVARFNDGILNAIAVEKK